MPHSTFPRVQGLPLRSRSSCQYERRTQNSDFFTALYPGLLTTLAENCTTISVPPLTDHSATLRGALFKEAAVVATRTPKTQISTTTRDHLSLRQKSCLTPKSCANTNKGRMIPLINISKMEDQALKKTTFARDHLHFHHHARQAVENELGKRRELPPRSRNLTLGRVSEREHSASGGIQRQEKQQMALLSPVFLYVDNAPSRIQRLAHPSIPVSMKKGGKAAQRTLRCTKGHPSMYIYLATRWTNLTRICPQTVGHLISSSCLHPTSVGEERTTFNSDIQVVCIDFWPWPATLVYTT